MAIEHDFFYHWGKEPYYYYSVWKLYDLLDVNKMKMMQLPSKKLISEIVIDLGVHYI